MWPKGNTVRLIPGLMIEMALSAVRICGVTYASVLADVKYPMCNSCGCLKQLLHCSDIKGRSIWHHCSYNLHVPRMHILAYVSKSFAFEEC